MNPPALTYPPLRTKGLIAGLLKGSRNGSRGFPAGIRWMWPMIAPINLQSTQMIVSWWRESWSCGSRPRQKSYGWILMVGWFQNNKNMRLSWLRTWKWMVGIRWTFLLGRLYRPIFRGRLLSVVGSVLGKKTNLSQYETNDFLAQYQLDFARISSIKGLAVAIFVVWLWCFFSVGRLDGWTCARQTAKNKSLWSEFGLQHVNRGEVTTNQQHNKQLQRGVVNREFHHHFVCSRFSRCLLYLEVRLN